MSSNEKRFCLMHSIRKILLQSLPIERADNPFENMVVGGSDALRREEGADNPSIYQQSSSRSQVVWVIDDSPTTRKILETCLNRAGYQVASFPDGVTALRWLLTPGVCLPDLLFLDIEMPKMDGYAVAQYLKAKPQYRSIPIVMLTGRHGMLDRLKSRLAGAEHYLTKPFRTQSILAIVQAHLYPTLALDEASIDRDTRVHASRP